ncbi:MAG: chemotaxis protein CheW [Thiothrix sp.]|jgi:chemotaxis signal transduction protein|uniref:chemotaxis protein CheW n=1 Tax=Thiothrix sp. TaxID=1032 RepID=UPI002616B91E|nr:chemotaxis protein CheW [Thiothrix sp.]MDD5391819.1 chemotaxis protein CheW [Thiothrix sp.]
MASPYELLAGLALLREKKRRSRQRSDLELQEWSGFRVQVGKLVCLIPCEQVEEVMTPTSVAVAHGVPAWVRGIAYFRAQLVTLVDVAGLLLGEIKAPTASSRVFVMRGKQEWFGLQVSAFDGVRHIWSDTVEAGVPDAFSGAWLQYVRQWLSLEGETVAVLDAGKLVGALENGEVRV